MPEDIYFNENFETELDDVGDIRTRDGEDAVMQAVATSVIEYRRDTAPGLTPNAIADKRESIESAVRANQFTEPPISVVVDSIDQSDREVTFRVETNRLSFPLTL